MQSTVTPTTARRLKDAGFPQPEFAFGQFWYSQNEQINIYVRPARPNIETHHFVGETLTTQHYKEDQVIFAPTATDILQELGYDFCIRFVAKSDGFMQDEFCINQQDDDGSVIDQDYHENPHEAAALAWLSKHEKDASTTN